MQRQEPGLVGAALLVIVSFAATSPIPAQAVDKCKVKIDARTGVLAVNANDVGGSLRWGSSAGDETNDFFNSNDCLTSGKARRCNIADPATEEARTPPTTCTLYLADDTTSCSAFIRGCTPGARSALTMLVKDADGVVVGISSDPSSAASAFREENGLILRIPLAVDGSGFGPFGGLYYTSDDCTGQPMMTAAYSQLGRNVQPVGPVGPGYIAPLTVSSQTTNSQRLASSTHVDQAGCDSIFGPGNTTFIAPATCCIAFMTVLDVGDATEIDLSMFTPPFTVVIE